jgi:hypothetical protein
MLAETTAGVTALSDAIGVTLPGASDASPFASYLEALIQIAQGAGFDGNDNGSRLESGPAGFAGTANVAGYLNPGASGDVPPFSSKPATVPSAGTLGGVGFRTGAQKIVLLATNTYPVSPTDRAEPFPDVVVGVGGIEVPTSFFQEVFTFPLLGPFQNPRYGPVSSSVSAADPVTSVAPKGAATLVEAFDLLADMNIEVVSFFQISQQSPREGLIDPKPVLSAIAQLTGAVDADRVPLTFELIGGNAADVADQIVAAIRPLLTGPKQVTLRAVGNDENFGFAYTPQEVTVLPGGQAQFQTTITGTGGPGMFEIHFVTQDGATLGIIPVSINLDGGAPTITGVNPAAGPAGTPVTITGTGFSTTPSDITVRFGDLPATVTSSTLTNIQTSVPAGSVAGPVNVVVTVDGQASNPFPFTIQHRITSFTPTSGQPGIPFVIQGTGFAPTVGGNTVTFGTTTATLTSASNTELRGTVPTLAAGPYPVRVTTNGVTTDVGTFTVILIPTLTNITPNRGPGDTPFAITGAGFSATAAQNTITFTDNQTGATANATVTSATTTRLEGRVPVQLVAGPHNVTVTVGGQRSMPLTFTVEPLLTGVSPATAVILQQLQISGTGFSPTLSENVVTLNGQAVPALPASSASTLVVLVPLGTTGTGLDVVVTTRGIASNTLRVPLSQVPGILTVSGIFTNRETLTINIAGFDPTGDVSSAAIVIRDGEGQVLGNFPSVSVSSVAANQASFNLAVPFNNANHFTAAMTVTVQLRDTAGNTSNAVTGRITNPDIRPRPTVQPLAGN